MTEPDTDTDDEPEHDRDLFRLSEGDEATLTMDDGSTIDVTITGTETYHDDSGPNIIEQTTVTMVDEDGIELDAAITDGLSGIPDADPFPSFFPLYELKKAVSGKEIPENAVRGYVSDVDSDALDGDDDD